MTKKFIKSAVILGLASITISMTQPVEAISNRLEYQEQYKRVKEELDALKEKGPKLGERSLYFRLVNKFLSWFGQVWDHSQSKKPITCWTSSDKSITW